MSDFCLFYAAVFIVSKEFGQVAGMMMFAGSAKHANGGQIGEIECRGRCMSPRVAATIHRAESSLKALSYRPNA